VTKYSTYNDKIETNELLLLIIQLL